MLNTKRFIINFLLSLTLITGFNLKAFAKEVPVIATAASVKFAVEEISKAFTSDTGLKIKLSFGSSGNFTRQIMQDAPFELFISADESYILRLHQQGFSDDKGVVYAKAKLALFIPKNSSLKADASLEDLKRAINDGRLQRFAIANPELAPYGRIAKELLLATALWQPLQGKLVLGENVAQAAQFAMSGATDGGIIAYSYTFTEAIKNSGQFVLLSETLHKPLLARMVLLNNAGETAKAFYQYLQQAKAKAIFARYGFE